MNSSQDPLCIALLVLNAIQSGQVNMENLGGAIDSVIGMLEHTRTNIGNLKDSTISALQESLTTMKRVCEPAVTAPAAPAAPIHAEESLLAMTAEIAKRLESLDVRIASMERQKSETERLNMRHMKKINDDIELVAHTVNGYSQIARSVTQELSQCGILISASAEFTIGQLDILNTNSKGTAKTLADIRDGVASTGTEVAKLGTQLDEKWTNIYNLMEKKLEEIRTKTEYVDSIPTTMSVHEGENSRDSAAASDDESDSLMFALDSLTLKFDGMKHVCELQSNTIQSMAAKSTEASEALGKISERVASLSKDCNDVIAERNNSKFVASSSKIPPLNQDDSRRTIRPPLQKDGARQCLSQAADDKSGSEKTSAAGRRIQSNSGSKKHPL